MLDVTSSSNLETASPYNFNFDRIKNRNTATVSLDTDGHVIAAQPIGK